MALIYAVAQMITTWRKGKLWFQSHVPCRREPKNMEEVSSKICPKKSFKVNNFTFTIRNRKLTPRIHRVQCSSDVTMQLLRFHLVNICQSILATSTMHCIAKERIKLKSLVVRVIIFNRSQAFLVISQSFYTKAKKKHRSTKPYHYL